MADRAPLRLAADGLPSQFQSGDTIALASGGTGATTASGARTNLGLGSMATQDASAVAITGGTATISGPGAPLTVSSTNSNTNKIVMQDGLTSVAFFGGTSSVPFQVQNSSGANLLQLDSSKNLFTFGHLLNTGGAVVFKTYTVATLPSTGALGAGARSVVTDASATTFNSVVAGGGANTVPVFCDGSNWRIG